MLLTGMKNQVMEWGFVSGKTYRDPFNDVDLDVVIRHENGQEWKVPAFWCGGNRWKVRFAAPHTGKYTFENRCTDSGNESLHGVAGQLTISEYEGDNKLYLHGPVKVSEDGRHFLHEDGTPFAWLGDTWWMAFSTRIKWPEELQMLIRDRVEKGFTVIQIINGLFCDCRPFDKRGENEAGYCWGKDWHAVNPAYYDLADLKFAALIQAGLVPCVAGAWGYYVKFMGVEKMKKHLRYMIARYGAYPVVWCVAGEPRMGYYEDKDFFIASEELKSIWSELAAYMKEIEPYGRLQTTHAMGDRCATTLDEVNNPEIFDFHMFQGTHSDFRDSIYECVVNPTQRLYDHQPAKPVVNSESNYEGIQERNGPDVQRFVFWHSMLNGAAGFTYGAHGIWQFNSEKDAFGPSPHGMSWGEQTWQRAYLSDGSKQMGIARAILNKFEWWKFKPAGGKLSYSEKLEKFFRPVASEIPGELVMVYLGCPVMQWNDDTKVKLVNLTPGAAYKVSYFDPVYGNDQDTRTVNIDDTGVWQVVTPPIMHDWVVVLEKA